MTEPIGPEELDELRSGVRDFLAAKAGEEQVHRLVDTDAPYDAAVWAQMAEQLGLQGLALPAEHGGDGYGFAGAAGGPRGDGTGPAAQRLPLDRRHGGVRPGALGRRHRAGSATSRRSPPARRPPPFAVAEGDGSWALDDIATTAERSTADGR